MGARGLRRGVEGTWGRSGTRGQMGGREEERTAILRLEEESGGWRQVLVEQVRQSPISDSASNACHVLAPSIRLCHLRSSPDPPPSPADLTLENTPRTPCLSCSVLITSRAVPSGGVQTALRVQIVHNPNIAADRHSFHRASLTHAVQTIIITLSPPTRSVRQQSSWRSSSSPQRVQTYGHAQSTDRSGVLSVHCHITLRSFPSPAQTAAPCRSERRVPGLKYIPPAELHFLQYAQALQPLAVNLIWRDTPATAPPARVAAIVGNSPSGERVPRSSTYKIKSCG